jgi:hypothetical protein
MLIIKKLPLKSSTKQPGSSTVPTRSWVSDLKFDPVTGSVLKPTVSGKTARQVLVDIDDSYIDISLTISSIVRKETLLSERQCLEPCRLGPI